jgi:hypothetical protein
MSARPGTPSGVEDILNEILGELRAINAKLAQSVPPPVGFTFDTSGITAGSSTLTFTTEPETITYGAGAT